VGTLAATGRTVLVSSHDLSELEHVCDWLILLETGRALYQGPTASLLDGAARGIAVVPQHPAELAALRDALDTRGFAVDGDDGALVVVAAPDGSSLGTGAAPAATALGAAVNRAAFDAGIVLAELRLLRTSLEDRFLAMTQGGRS
jgi:ABC-2 type transport system ATP-binding protein